MSNAHYWIDKENRAEVAKKHIIFIQNNFSDSIKNSVDIGGEESPSRPLAGTPEQTREIADPRGFGLSCGVGSAPWTQLEV